MKLFYVHDICIKCSPFVLVLIPLMLILDSISVFMIGITSLCMHELAHVWAARCTNIFVKTIELQPFGFVARMDFCGSLCIDRIAVAVAGPAFSIMTGLSCSALCTIFSIDGEIATKFVAINLGLGIINLLPALPLDGGRILMQLLSMVTDERSARRLCAGIGIILGAALVIIGVIGAILDTLNFTLMIFGIFLALAAINEFRAGTEAVKNILRRGTNIRRGDALRIRSIAMHRSTSISDALNLVSSGSYNVIIVLDDNARVVGSIDEGLLLEKSAVFDSETPIFELL